MENIIFKYLDKKYTTDVGNVGNYGIYLKNEVIEIYRSPYNGRKLCNEVSTVFGFDMETSKIFINSWAQNVKKVNDLTFYWTYHCGIELDLAETILPLATRISARTIGHDLVSVQPLSAPKNLINYRDFQYGEDPIRSASSKNVEIDYDESERAKVIEKFIEGLHGGLPDHLVELYGSTPIQSLIKPREPLR